MKITEELREIKANAIEDAKLEATRAALLHAVDLIDRRLVPLQEDPAKAEERRRREDKKTLVSALLLASFTGFLLTFAGLKAKKEIEHKEAVEKERLEQDKKDLYRTLARIKGRV